MTTAWTLVEERLNLDSSSNSGIFEEVPSRAAKCPPADCPQKPIRIGSTLWLLAFAQSHWTAALQSRICAGKIASLLKRYSILIVK